MTEAEIAKLLPGSKITIAMMGRTIKVTVKTIDMKGRRLFTDIGPVDFDKIVTFGKAAP